MTRVVIEMKQSSGCEQMTRLLTALACLGEDDEIELISSHDSEAFRAVLKEHGCECDRAREEKGRCTLLIRRRA